MLMKGSRFNYTSNLLPDSLRVRVKFWGNNIFSASHAACDGFGPAVHPHSQLHSFMWETETWPAKSLWLVKNVAMGWSQHCTQRSFQRLAKMSEMLVERDGCVWQLKSKSVEDSSPLLCTSLSDDLTGAFRHALWARFVVDILGSTVNLPDVLKEQNRTNRTFWIFHAESSKWQIHNFLTVFFVWKWATFWFWAKNANVLPYGQLIHCKMI